MNAEASKNERYTPAEEVQWCAQVAGVASFDLDPAACAESHHAPRYFTVADDGLAQPWAADAVFCNPPFDDVPSWVSKAIDEVKIGRVRRCVALLIPANRTERPFWHELIEPRLSAPVDGVSAKLHHRKARTRFILPGGQRMGSPKFAVCCIVFTRQIAHIKRMAAGRRRAVTPELLAEGRRLLADGYGLLAMCERLGVHHRSWYRAVKPERPRGPRRYPMALPRSMVRRVKRLRAEGRTLKEIAETTGLHLNTVHKYLRRAGAHARRSTPTPPPA